MQEKHRIRHPAFRIAPRSAYRGIVDPQLRQHLAAAEMKIADEEIAFRHVQVGHNAHQITSPPRRFASPMEPPAVPDTMRR